MPHPVEPSGTNSNRTYAIERNVLCYFAAFFVLALGAAALGPTLVELAGQTRSELSVVSILFSMRAFGYLISARLIGRIYEIAHGHRLMALSLLTLGSLYFFIPFLSSIYYLSPVVFLIGVTGAFVDLGGNILILWAVRGHVGPHLNGLHFSFGLGAFVSPLLVAFMLILTGSGVGTYWIIGVLTIPVAYWIYKTPVPDHPTVSKKYENPPQFSSISLVLVVLFFFLYAGGEQSFGGWIHTYGVRQNEMAEVTAAYLTSVFWGCMAIGRLLAIPLLAHFRLRNLLFVQTFGTVICFGALLLFPTSTLITWACAAMMGMLMSSLFPLMLAFVEPYTAGSGRTTSWFFIGAGAGGMTVPWLIGQFIDTVGPLFFSTSLLLCMSLGCICLVLLNRFIKSNN